MVDLSDHPSVEELMAFDLGQLPSAEQVRIEEHVAQCDSCCRQLETVPDDALVALMKASTRGATDSHDSTPTEPASEPAAASPEPPAELADHPRYRIVRFLGAGGMGAVFQAEHRLMQRPVALKVVQKQLIARPGAVLRFRQEVKAAARLTHPNIVTAYDAEQAGDLHFLVMEFVDGIDLAELARRRGPLPVREACDYIRQAALGLQHAHEQGMVHRDIKPQNLMLSVERRSATSDSRHGVTCHTVKILDFGLARFVSESEQAEAITQSGLVLGTTDYLAPEQARDPRQADIRADIYSLGCTLYHLLAGQPPFPQGTPLQKLIAHQEQEPTSLSTHRTDVPAELEQVLARMMAKEPAQRYQTPAEVAAALAPFATEGRSATRSGRWLWMAAAALLVAAILPEAYSFGPAIYRFATDQGQIVIEANAPEVEIAVKQDGREIRILDGRTQQAVNLKSGTYELELMGGEDGLMLSTNQFTLSRNGQFVVRVYREAAPVAAAPPSSSSGEIRRFEGHTGGVWALAVSSDGRFAVSASDDKTLRIWDVAGGQELRCLKGHREGVRSVAISPDDARMVSGSRDRSIRLWDIQTGRELRRYAGHRGLVDALTFAPAGDVFLSGGWDRTIRLWDVERGAMLHKFNVGAYGLAISPDGTQALSASGQSARLWDLESRRELRAFKADTDSYCVAFDPNVPRALSANWDGTIHLWDLETGRELVRMLGHEGPVVSIAFSHDGQWALSASIDKTVRLWDVQSGRELRRWEGHTRGVRCAAFLPDGRHVLSGSLDGTLRLWEVSDHAQEEAIESRPK